MAQAESGASRSPGARRWIWNRPYLLLVFTAFCWGANAVAGRFAVGEVSPMVITCLRWTIVVLALTVTAGRSVRAELPRLWPWRVSLFLMGALGFTGFNAVFYLAAHHTSAINIGLIQGLMPALVLLGGFLVFRTPVSGFQLAGLLLAIVGVAVATCRGSLEVLLHLDFNIGDLWMLGATILYSGYAVALRRKPPVAPLTFFSAMALAALVTSLPLLAWEVANGTAVWPATPRGFGVMLFIGIVPSLVSQITFMRGVELIGPGRAGLFINLVPVFAAGLGVAVLGESFGPANAVALALVLGGIGLAERGRRA